MLLYNVCNVVTMTSPPQVSDRFPDLDSLVTAKLLLPHEAARLQRVDHRTPHEATWTPILWALKLVCKAR